MPAYYKDDGTKLKGKELKKYLKAGKGYYTAEQLMQKYNGFSLGDIRLAGKYRSLLTDAPALYKQASDEELTAQATAGADTEANLAKSSAESLYNSNKTTLANQLASLDPTYASQVNAAQKQTAQSVDSLQGSMLSRGLGRSSYAGALQQAALQSGNNTVSGILNEKGQAQNSINNQISTLGTNYNTALNTIAQNRNSTIKSTFDTLKENNYSKYLSSADARDTFLWNLLNQKKKVSSGGGGSTRTTTTTNNTSSSDSNSSQFNVFEWLGNLFGGNS